MRDPPLILVADDVPDNLEILEMRLESQGYAVATAVDGAEAVEKTRALQPDLLLLDIMMPKVDGIEALKAIKADPTLPFIPVILVTARADAKDVIVGLESGADDYLTKPVDHAALSARVRAMLRIKSLHDTVQAQAQRLEQQAADLAALNRTLEQRVAAQVDEIERVGRLKRFLAPQIVDTIIASGGETMLEHHRRDIVVLFCDMRGFTAFSETAEPEDVMTVLGEYFGVLGPLIDRYEGTLERFTGDGMFVLFNDPIPCPDPAHRAVRLAVEMRDAVAALAPEWAVRGHELGFGVGIAQGYATLGQIGFEGRFHYTAMGTVINLAARLCADAESGQILVTRRIAAATDGVAEYEPLGDIAVRGLSRPVAVLNIRCLIS
jgi:class 3 adenylate cyclase